MILYPKNPNSLSPSAQPVAMQSLMTRQQALQQEFMKKDYRSTIWIDSVRNGAVLPISNGMSVPLEFMNSPRLPAAIKFNMLELPEGFYLLDSAGVYVGMKTAGRITLALEDVTRRVDIQHSITDVMAGQWYTLSMRVKFQLHKPSTIRWKLLLSNGATGFIQRKPGNLDRAVMITLYRVDEWSYKQWARDVPESFA